MLNVTSSGCSSSNNGPEYATIDKVSKKNGATVLKIPLENSNGMCLTTFIFILTSYNAFAVFIFLSICFVS